jgi:hypothetical protein
MPADSTETVRAKLRALVEASGTATKPRTRAKWLLDVSDYRPLGGAAFVVDADASRDLRKLRDAAPNADAFPAAVVDAKPVVAINADQPSHAPILGILVGIVAARVANWEERLATAADAKPEVTNITSLITEGGARRRPKHGDGNAVDIGGDLGYDADEPVGVRSLIRVAIEKGAKGVGLPFQGKLFPESRKCGVATAADGKMLKLDSPHVWNAQCATQTSTHGASAYIQDDEVRNLVKGVEMVFPDRNNHIHLAAIA